ncbi:MAG: YhgE/Pip domain-containing protein [Clostridia bacterium]|nr:YhgE/Pip domain-containing protein [Clostridia bacterium]
MMRRKIGLLCALVLILISAAAFVLGGCELTAAGMMQTTGLPAAEKSILPSTPAEYAKSENVYARLNVDGSLAGAYVVNSYAVKSAGAILDYGAYATVENLTDLSAIDQQRDEIAFRAAAGNFYYQGNMSGAELPWHFEISYTLDGKDVAAAALAGATGQLQIRIKTGRNPAGDSLFYDNYLLQVSLTLDAEHCRNISAANATIAAAGEQKQITFSVLPQSEGDLLLSADISDFAMDGISIAAVPFNMEFPLPDTAGLTGGLNDLAGGIADLDSGVQELSSGMRTLTDNAGDVAAGSRQIMDGLAELSGNSSQLTSGSAQILSALKKIDRGLSKADFSDLDDLAQLPAALRQFSAALGEMQDSLAQLQPGYGGAYAALDSAIVGLSPVGSISQEALEALLYSTAPENYNTILALIADYAAAQTIKGIYGQTQPVFAAVAEMIPGLAAGLAQLQVGLDKMASELGASLGGNDVAEQLAELSDGLAQLAANYKKFDQGLNEYIDGVGSLSANYPAFNHGLLQYLDGVASAGSGISRLAGGSAELTTATGDMPNEVDTVINELMAQYDYADFTPQSFTDSRNSHIIAVQFIMTTEPIAKSKPQMIAEPEQPQGFFDRLLALFR